MLSFSENIRINENKSRREKNVSYTGEVRN
jgi:hypothetical protein